MARVAEESAGRNGVPPPRITGWTTSAYSAFGLGTGFDFRNEHGPFRRDQSQKGRNFGPLRRTSWTTKPFFDVNTARSCPTGAIVPSAALIASPWS